MPRNAASAPRIAATARKRGRPRLADAAVLQERILAAARDLFYERGFARVTMDAVALRAEISKGTLYSRFPGKPELFIAVFEDQIRLWWERANVESAPALRSGLVEMLRYRADKILEASLSAEIVALRQVVDAARHQFPDLARMFHEVGTGRGVRDIAVEIDAAIAAEGGVCRDAHGIASAFMYLLNGWTNEKIMIGQTATVTRAERLVWIDRTLALFVEGRRAW